MHRFFVKPEDVYEDHIEIKGADVHHISRVLRLSSGDEIIICDGQSHDFYCIITKVDDTIIEASVKEQIPSKGELSSKIILFQGIPKGDKMDLIVQKAVELGAYAIVPVSMKRCISKIHSKNQDKKIKRWQDIAVSAAKQSKRGIIPEVMNQMTFAEAVEYASSLDIVISAYEDQTDIKTSKDVFNHLKAGQIIGLFIGPEGGFDKAEISMLELIQSKVITLGKRILRTETAGMAAMAIMMFQLEEE